MVLFIAKKNQMGTGGLPKRGSMGVDFRLYISLRFLLPELWLKLLFLSQYFFSLKQVIMSFI